MIIYFGINERLPYKETIISIGMEKTDNRALAEHFFRTEYGKIVSVITRYLGAAHVETAEDIVQETLLKAVDYWQHNGIPKNPEGWLYATAKNLTLNILKRKKYQQAYESEKKTEELENLQFTERTMMDEQLKMMFVCCHPSISESSQIALTLKILCGFSIAEIANAFFSNTETINKRLVRGRKQLRESNISFEIPENISEKLTIVLKTIYLLFNEGYYPSQKKDLIRYDLCLEAVRLAEIIAKHEAIVDKKDSYALLSLMYLNASRFEARMNTEYMIIEMEKQDRAKWNQALINKGLSYLNKGMTSNSLSPYLILAAISANHSVAKSFEETNWKEILSLYDSLLILEDSPITRLNRSVALAKVKGHKIAISELKTIEENTTIGESYLFHSTLGELYKLAKKEKKAIKHYEKAISLTSNERTIGFLRKKIIGLVPIS